MDFLVIYCGSVSTLTPITRAAQDWVTLHLPDDAPRFGDSIVVEARFISDIINGIQADGLTLE